MNALVLARRDCEAKPRPSMVSAKRALHLVAGAHAARADDAQLGIEGEVRIAGVLLGAMRWFAPS